MNASDRQAYIESHIPYRMQAIAWGLHLLRGTRDWDKPKSMEVIIDGSRCITGSHLALTNRSIEIAIIYSRVLLEFLGLKANREKKDFAVQVQRRSGDVGIEHFGSPESPLPLITPEEALATYPGRRDDAKLALLGLIAYADRSVAHLTSGPLSGDLSIEHIELGLRGVLTLVHKLFYRRLGIEPPDYEVESRKK